MDSNYTPEDIYQLAKSLHKKRGLFGRVGYTIVDGEFQSIEQEVKQRKTDERQFRLIEDKGI